MIAKLTQMRLGSEPKFLGYYKFADRTALIDFINTIDLGFSAYGFVTDIDEERLKLYVSVDLGWGPILYWFHFEILE